jgi:hypothetical protein
MKWIFMSHSSKDDDVALRIADELRQRGKQIWIDDYEIKPSKDLLPQQISDALQNCDIFILLWSKNAANSESVKLEWNAAWKQM